MLSSFWYCSYDRCSHGDDLPASQMAAARREQSAEYGNRLDCPLGCCSLDRSIDRLPVVHERASRIVPSSRNSCRHACVWLGITTPPAWPERSEAEDERIMVCSGHSVERSRPSCMFFVSGYDRRRYTYTSTSIYFPRNPIDLRPFV